MNPLDAHFRSLELTSMDVVARSTPEFAALQDYVHHTHGYTHNIKVDILNAFRVERQAEADAFVGAGNDRLVDGERFLLWHGSRTTNFAGILKQGLRIAPPEAPVTGEETSFLLRDVQIAESFTQATCSARVSTSLTCVHTLPAPCSS